VNELGSAIGERSNHKSQIKDRKSEITNPSPDHPIYQRAFQILLAAAFAPLPAAPGAETTSVRTTPVPFFKAARVALPASSLTLKLKRGLASCAKAATRAAATISVPRKLTLLSAYARLKFSSTVRPSEGAMGAAVQGEGCCDSSAAAGKHGEY
jgi:hypothetical protein